MIGALIYLQSQSLKNRLRARLRRLKKPKYLAGAVVGAAYFYFFFFRHFFAGRRPTTNVTPETLLLFELVGALALFVMVMSAWIFPHERAALAFSEAEIAFLFPAPVTRKALIHFKLLRSQLAILFTTLLLTLVTRRFGGGAGWIRALGWWLILSTLNLHTLAASFARTRLLERGISNWRRRAVLLSAATALVVAASLWVRHNVPAPRASDFESLEMMKYYFRHTLESGPASYVLYPFRLVVRPYLATDGWTFLVAAGPVLALMLFHYWWVMKSDVAFE
ncbi:MAG TPA: putative ABC exporter domain-containing protein, partial [Candidatus Angelobacter sp.]|nr:putative ABC exporter domain-containing protein [Candidatus Angelobacter sp.]